MKKTITLLILLILPAVLFSQMKVSDNDKGEEIGTFKTLGETYAKLIAYDKDEVVFYYRDEKFKKLTDFKHFVLKRSDLDDLYLLFADLDSVEKGDSKKVELESGDVLIFDYKAMMGKKYAQVSHIDRAGNIGEIRWMNEKQLKKLFGKK